MDDTLRQKIDSLLQLNRNRYEYVIARSRSATIDAACEQIGVSRQWFYNYPVSDREYLEELAVQLRHARTIQAELILEQAVSEAAEVKAAGLRSRIPYIQQAAATEILDRVKGKPMQRQQTEHSGRVEIVVRYADD